MYYCVFHITLSFHTNFHLQLCVRMFFHCIISFSICFLVFHPLSFPSLIVFFCYLITVFMHCHRHSLVLLFLSYLPEFFEIFFSPISLLCFICSDFSSFFSLLVNFLSCFFYFFSFFFSFLPTFFVSAFHSFSSAFYFPSAHYFLFSTSL